MGTLTTEAPALTPKHATQGPPEELQRNEQPDNFVPTDNQPQLTEEPNPSDGEATDTATPEHDKTNKDDQKNAATAAASDDKENPETSREDDSNRHPTRKGYMEGA
jgi:hypothetical protein